MFPSAGYFRSANCPFFIHGLCHRPYCHFRHAKPGHGSSSKTSIKSCLKSKTTATKTECTDNSISQPQSATETNNAGIKRVELGSVLGDDEIKNTEKIEPEKAAKTNKTSNKETQKTSPNKTSLSILESLNKLEQAVEEASATLHSAPCSSKKISNLINTSVKEKNTCEKKTLKTAVQTKESTSTKEKTVCEKKTLKTAVQTKESTSTKEKTICEKKPLKTAIQTKESTSKIESSTVQTNKDNTVKQQSFTLEISSNNCTELEENSSLEEKQMDFEDSNKIQEGKETKNINKELGKEVVDTSYKYSNNIKRKHDKIDEGLRHSAKKRKTSCSSDDTPRKSKESTLRNSLVKTHIDTEKETIKKKKGVTKDIIQRKCTDGQPKKVEESSKTIKTKAAKEELKNMDKVTLDKAEKKDAKVKRQLMDIDFFTLSKKSKLKTHGKVKAVEPTDKPEKTDQVKLKTLRRQAKPKTSSDIKSHDIKTPEISSKTGGGLKANISIDSLFESDEDKDDSSDSISDSEQDTMDSGTDTLKEIFDNYDPQQDREKRVSTQNTAGTSGVMSVDVSPAKDKNTSPAELQGLGKKKRVAHNASYLVQRKGSNINPIRRLPKDSPSISAKQPQPTTLERNALQTKRRVAHIPKPTTDTSLPRPRIPTEYGAKVPQNLRQRYLDKIIDENLRLYATEKEAFDRGVEEERSIYQRATRRPMYLNLCCNAIKVLRSKPTPDFQTDPDPSPAGMSSATGTTGSSKAMKNSSKEIDPSNLTEEMTYELLSQYIMTEEQLVENGYPRPCPSTPGKVTFKPRRPLPTPSKDPNRRTCCRCGKNYSINDDGTYVRQEDCVYHVGRLFRRRTAGEISSSFQCCGGDASTPGCAVCKFHVCEGKNQTEGFMTTIISPLAGNQKKVFGVDCEMCYTIAGLELTRVTVVDWKLEKIYDTFVKPDNPILDYNTRFSGVTRECLRGVKTSIREVQAVLLSMISKDSILVGHSLESDLLSLKLVHDTVVDTSVVFPHRLGPPYKRALRTLMAEFVKKIIQNNEEGHDSYEDAKASLELMLFKVKEDLKKKPKNKR